MEWKEDGSGALATNKSVRQGVAFGVHGSLAGSEDW